MPRKGYTDLKTIFSISMSPALQAQLDEEAAKRYRSRSAMIEDILRAYFLALGGSDNGTEKVQAADRE